MSNEDAVAAAEKRGAERGARDVLEALEMRFAIVGAGDWRRAIEAYRAEWDAPRRRLGDVLAAAVALGLQLEVSPDGNGGAHVSFTRGTWSADFKTYTATHGTPVLCLKADEIERFFNERATDYLGAIVDREAAK